MARKESSSAGGDSQEYGNVRRLYPRERTNLKKACSAAQTQNSDHEDDPGPTAA
jgi:hypothetical protein